MRGYNTNWKDKNELITILKYHKNKKITKNKKVIYIKLFNYKDPFDPEDISIIGIEQLFETKNPKIIIQKSILLKTKLSNKIHKYKRPIYYYCSCLKYN